MPLAGASDWIVEVRLATSGSWFQKVAQNVGDLPGYSGSSLALAEVLVQIFLAFVLCGWASRSGLCALFCASATPNGQGL
jgi:hypothetical protein